MNTAVSRILLVAGSDSGGGAGVQADLKTVTALGGWGMTAITALTAQNTLGVQSSMGVPPELVAAQIDACATDIGVDAVKTGMLFSAQIVEAVATAIRRLEVGIVVVDPVMVATSGAPLLEPDAVEKLRLELLPLASVVTPNLPEASRLLGRVVGDLRSMREAARALSDMGARAALVKGGHLAGSSVDVLFDGKVVHDLPGERIDRPNTHGTGCILASALATRLAQGATLVEAAADAKRFVTRAIQAGLPLGSGVGPANPGRSPQRKIE